LTVARHLRALGFVVALAIGCHRAAVAPPAPAAEVRGAGDARRLLADQERETRTLTALFKLTFRRGDGAAESSRGALVVARPDRLRLQIFSFGMITAYDYTVNGDRYRVRRPLERVDHVGRFGEDAQNAEDALGADLRPLFLRTGDFSKATVSETPDAFVVRSGDRTIEIAKAVGRVTRETIAVDGKPAIVTEYGDYRPVDGFPMPFTIRVAYPAKAATLVIDVERYTRNRPVDDSLFRF
jgi:hypothetical protein